MDARKERLDFLNIFDKNCDILTPHKMAIIVLVQEYLAVKHMDDPHKMVEPNYRRKFCMVLMKLMHEPDLTYDELNNLLSKGEYSIDEQHYECFQNMMDSICRTYPIDGMFDLVNYIVKLVTDEMGGTHHSFGLIGYYIRKLVITLERMSFTETIALCKSLNSYYMNGLKKMKVIDKDLQILIKDYKPKKTVSKWSHRQVEFFVIQQNSLFCDEKPEALSPIELQKKLNTIIQENPVTAHAHFLSYYNNLRTRDYNNSIEALHKAFDRNSFKDVDTTEMNEWQYPSMHLAILHAHFNHRTEALASLKECIMLAQESDDTGCLQMAREWLSYLDQEYVQFNDYEHYETDNGSGMHLLPFNIQVIVKVAALAGFPPAKLFDMMTQTEGINFQYSMMLFMGSCITQRAALWTMYGRNEIASLYSQMHLHSVKLRTKSDNDLENGEAGCDSLCTLALWLSLQGQYTISEIILGQARVRYPRDPLAQLWMKCDCYITALQNMYLQKWNCAIKAAQQLYIVDKPLSLLVQAGINLARGNNVLARSLVEMMLLDKDLTNLMRVRGLIVLANTYILQTTIVDQVVFVLSEASVLANKMFFQYEVSMIDAHFALILLSRGMPSQALRTVRRCMEFILANGGIYDRAKIMFLFVKCRVAVETRIEKKAEQMEKCKQLLEDAVDLFSTAGAFAKVIDIYVFLAKFYNEINRIEERNKYSSAVKLHYSEHPTPVEYLNIFY